MTAAQWIKDHADYTGAAFFNSLPEDDPHYIPNKEAKRAKRQEETQQRNQRRLDALMSLYS